MLMIDELIETALEEMQTDIYNRATIAQLTTKYDKTEVNALLMAKQDVIADNTLPLVKVSGLQAQLDSKAPATSPNFIGVSISTNNRQITTTAFVKHVVAGLVDGAPESFHSLKEISATLQNDSNYFTTINNALASNAPTNNATPIVQPHSLEHRTHQFNGLNIANISGLQTQINDFKTNAPVINNLADGAIPIAKVNGLASSLDSKLTTSSNIEASKIINWANLANSSLEIANINYVQAQLDAKAGNRDPILVSRVDGLQTALNAKAPLASPTLPGIVLGITASMVGLGNVNNTSDVKKPISRAVQTARDGKLATTGNIPIS